jgi:hypothetical protein
MMKRASLGLAAVAIALTACGEKPQALADGKRKADSHAWQGSTNAGYAAGGWKAGDEAAWEAQMRKRAQGQNEYSRTNTQ